MWPLVILVLALATAAVAAFVPIYFGRHKSGYSHMRHTISELGEAGSPVERSVALYGFLPMGLLTWLTVYLAAEATPEVSRETYFSLSLVGAGYVGGALFRCDADAPMFGSWRSALHNVFGALEYVGAAGAFFSMERDSYWGSLSAWAKYAGYVALFSLFGVGFPHPYRGLVQRVAETAIFGMIVLMAWRICAV